MGYNELPHQFIEVCLGVFIFTTGLVTALIIRFIQKIFGSMSLRRLENDIFSLGTFSKYNEKEISHNEHLWVKYKGTDIRITALYSKESKPAKFGYSYYSYDIINIFFNENHVAQLLVTSSLSAFMKHRVLYFNANYDTTDFWPIIKIARKASNEKWKEFHRIRHEQESKLPKPY